MGPLRFDFDAYLKAMLAIIVFVAICGAVAGGLAVALFLRLH
jgi:hypothetical protein